MGKAGGILCVRAAPVLFAAALLSVCAVRLDAAAIPVLLLVPDDVAEPATAPIYAPVPLAPAVSKRAGRFYAYGDPWGPSGTAYSGRYAGQGGASYRYLCERYGLAGC